MTAMSSMLRADAIRTVIRQIESADGLRDSSTVQSGGGFRFAEETHIHEPSGPGYSDYWYWEKISESGGYVTEQEAFDAGVEAIAWLKNSN